MQAPWYAIIGSGITGLACARALVRHGHSVQLFEKSRGPGGRLASRRTQHATFDLGAQYFTARSGEFQEELNAWRETGVVGRWPHSLWVCENGHWQPKLDDEIRWVGAPRMSALTRYLSQGLDLRTQCRIEHLIQEGAEWWLRDAKGLRHGPFNKVIVTLPAPQALSLLAPHSSLLAQACQRIEMSPCWAAYALLEASLPRLEIPEPGWQAAFMNGGPLRFVTRNASKPGREDQGESLSLLATSNWSRTHLERDPQWVATRLLAAFTERYPAPLPDIQLLDAHRWRFAQPESEMAIGNEAQDFLIDSSGLALGGDGLSAGRLEDAWHSGHRLGNYLSKQEETTA
ncbi:NAD(P)/FAD-dependent oxidoreductase [Halomonas sp. GXIMD04776]|uniref:NAD(P)/FAD-dependent oxidoreductase n=1 Tax=Halomonas sp. GXIMD04776 TaxID=3415605 RepID=UPI003CBB439A